VKVFVSNFKVEKSENLDNAFYVFLRFFDMTLQKNVKSRVFLDFQKKRKKRILEQWFALPSTVSVRRKEVGNWDL